MICDKFDTCDKDKPNDCLYCDYAINSTINILTGMLVYLKSTNFDEYKKQGSKLDSLLATLDEKINA